jgi:VWFA-related protein
VSLLLAVLAGSVGAQVVPPAPAVPSSPAAQAGPMELDVVVTDKDGHPVSGLQQSDFTLIDSGHPAPIRSFQAMGGSTGQNEPIQVLLVVDEVNTGFEAVSVERTQLHNLLTQNQGHLPFPVTIAFLTDTGIKQVNQPTTDGNQLDAALQKTQSTLRAIPQSAGFYGGTDRLQISLKALYSLTSTLAPMPGRKLMVWISQGWWMFDNPNVYISEQQRRSFFSAIVDLSAALRDGRITVYAVDPLGTQDAGSFRNMQWQDFLKPVRDAKHADPGDLALQVLSTQGGGLALYGSNNIAGEISHCLDDGSIWYRITFDPQHADAPNTWHDLAVKLDKNGLKIRTRNGYYAGP